MAAPRTPVSARPGPFPTSSKPVPAPYIPPSSHSQCRPSALPHLLPASATSCSPQPPPRQGQAPALPPPPASQCQPPSLPASAGSLPSPTSSQPVPGPSPPSPLTRQCRPPAFPPPPPSQCQPPALQHLLPWSASSLPSPTKREGMAGTRALQARRHPMEESCPLLGCQGTAVHVGSGGQRARHPPTLENLSTSGALRQLSPCLPHGTTGVAMPHLSGGPWGRDKVPLPLGPFWSLMSPPTLQPFQPHSLCAEPGG